MTIATDMLASYLAAEAAVLAGKTVQFSGRTMTHENLSEIRKGRLEWERRVQAEQGQRSATFGGLSYAAARFDGGFCNERG
ncbi:MAG: hypothetical protein EOO78_29995 [Oxalobacteraceae bacterium]|nr:MAG: hypothetical protein EOO78_29995 [Oxalobacteraceae bacterium]